MNLYWVWFFIICVILFITFIIVFEMQEKHNAIQNWVWIILLFVIIFYFISLFLYLYYRPIYIMSCIGDSCVSEVIFQEPMENMINPCENDCLSISDLNPYNKCYQQQDTFDCTFDCNRKLLLSDLNPYNTQYNTSSNIPCNTPCNAIYNTSYKEDIFTKSKIPMSMLCPY